MLYVGVLSIIALLAAGFMWFKKNKEGKKEPKVMYD
jgi:hypothetical protein